MTTATPARPPKGRVMVRNSERSSFLTCRWKWYQGWVLQLKVEEEAPALEFGTGIHLALEKYYKPGIRRGPKPAETFEKWVEKRVNQEGAFNLWSDGDWMSGLDLGVRMLEGYVEKWKDRDKEYRVIQSEQTFQLPVGKVLGHKIVMVGTFDGVWEHLPSRKRGHRVLRFAEHKTTTAIKKDQLNMDEQAGTYWAYGPRWLKLQGVIKATDVFDGILYNFLRKAAPDPEATYTEDGVKLNLPEKKVLIPIFHEHDIPIPKAGTGSGKNGALVVRDYMAALAKHDIETAHLGKPSANQDAAYFDRELTFRGLHEAEAVKERYMKIARDMIEARRNPEDHVYKNPGPQFMPNCRFCQFRDMCEVHETGNDWEAVRNALFKGWEPYADHELPERV